MEFGPGQGHLPRQEGEPDQIQVQHILIGVRSSGSPGTRSRQDAENLATELLERARSGENFSDLVRTYSEDPVRPGDPLPGSYRMTNHGVKDSAWQKEAVRAQTRYQNIMEDLRNAREAGHLSPEDFQTESTRAQQDYQKATRASQVFPRDEMVPAFGNVGFPLAVGEVGLAPYHPKDSSFGFHIIKRLK